MNVKIIIIQIQNKQCHTICDAMVLTVGASWV